MEVHYMTVFTIRGEARESNLPEHFLRSLLRQNQLPGFYAGTRYYVNHELFMEQLDAMSRREES